MEKFPKPKPKSAERPPGQVTPAQEPNIDKEVRENIEHGKEEGSPPKPKNDTKNSNDDGNSDSQNQVKNQDLANQLNTLKENPTRQRTEPDQTTEIPNRKLAEDLGSREQHQAPKPQTEQSDNNDNM
jgi:hypothetical protein